MSNSVTAPCGAVSGVRARGDLRGIWFEDLGRYVGGRFRPPGPAILVSTLAGHEGAGMAGFRISGAITADRAQNRPIPLPHGCGERVKRCLQMLQHVALLNPALISERLLAARCPKEVDPKFANGNPKSAFFSQKVFWSVKPGTFALSQRAIGGGRRPNTRPGHASARLRLPQLGPIVAA